MLQGDAMVDADGEGNKANPAGWRRLGLFWVSVLVLMAIGGGVVQWLGPPTQTKPREAAAAQVPPPAHIAAHPPSNPSPLTLSASHGLVAPVTVGRDTPGPTVDPDPALSEPTGGAANERLPRIASDGRTPMRVYAAGFDHSSRRPRVGLLLAGIGPNEAESDAAIRALPGAVSLAVSPYSANVAKLLGTARALGHEYLIAIPLEPVGFPLNDPGPATLLTGASAAENIRNLYWALSRIDGYVGATGVIGTMRGERLAAMTDQMDTLLTALSERGLLYVDPREYHPEYHPEYRPEYHPEYHGENHAPGEHRGALAKAWGRQVDLVVDVPSGQEGPDRAAIDVRLAALEQQAKDTGSALGLVMRPTPVAVARIAAWSNGLTDRGLALAPVSALALPPSETPLKLTERQP
jgi:uncharacterized protein